MKRIELACYALAASAFVQAGLLCYGLPGRFTPEAKAELVIKGDSVTMLTAQSRSNDEALFVIDDNTQSLLIYTVNITKNRMDVVASANLAQMFDTGARPGAGERRGGDRPR